MPIVATNIDPNEVYEVDREWLISLLESSTFDHRQRLAYRAQIDRISTVSEMESLSVVFFRNQVGIDGIVNPSQRDINNHLRRAIR